MKTIILLALLLASQCSAWLNIIAINQEANETSVACMKATKYDSVYFRALKNGKLDPTLIRNLRVISDSEMHWTFFLEPNAIAGDPSEQAQAVINVTMYMSRRKYIPIDVYNVHAWGKNKAKNAEFLQTMINKFEAKDCRCVVISSKYSWAAIMGAENHDFSSNRLWLVNEDGNPDMNDFDSFGGWKIASYKTYRTNYNTCGFKASRVSF
ncbi:MAG: hypothetical protein P4M11_16035 [Candidatus Pacebacteria bacterium]|nr:hypothetical protein [Candidatus Paceibacterota bacterium]